MIISEQLLLPDINATKKIALDLASSKERANLLLLKGNLGSGKTSFARFFIQSLVGDEVDVTSPTFNLVHLYDAKDGRKIWHYDLYRLKSPGEIEELSLDDALDDICIIEWPEIIEHLLPKKRLELCFSHHNNSRKLELISR